MSSGNIMADIIVEEKCQDCDNGKVECPKCKGKGVFYSGTHYEKIHFCVDCDKTGKVKCPKCEGSGKRYISKSENEENMRIRESELKEE